MEVDQVAGALTAAVEDAVSRVETGDCNVNVSTKTFGTAGYVTVKIHKED